MNKLFALLFLCCAMSCWAQQPLLKTHWTQEYPYNQHCPTDPFENDKHCYTGCPATAMGQIINYLQTTQGTRFNDDDDYYTGDYFGRQYNIDDDWETYGFPSFTQLNEMLDSADATFQRGATLSESLMAAVVFACGVACKEVFTASDSYGSGTYYVNQAFEAYRRFGFANCSCSRNPTQQCSPSSSPIFKPAIPPILPSRIPLEHRATMSLLMATAKVMGSSISISAGADNEITGTNSPILKVLLLDGQR